MAAHAHHWRAECRRLVTGRLLYHDRTFDHPHGRRPPGHRADLRNSHFALAGKTLGQRDPRIGACNHGCKRPRSSLPKERASFSTTS